jgi:hypothetical protein
MSSRNLSYTIRKTDKAYDLKIAIKTAIKNNAKEYLNPPIKNISYKGILKTSEEIKKWFKNSKYIKGDFKTTAMLMEKAGNGGAIFRNIYRDFLKESYEISKVDNIKIANLGGGGFVLDLGRTVLHLNVGERVGAGGIANQHRVALGIVARPGGFGAIFTKPR